MNFARDVVEAAPPGDLALVERARDGSRRTWTFGETARRSAAMAAALHRVGVRRGDVVLTLIGNRPEWVQTMVACLGAGYVVLPCTEQLRAHDLELRLAATTPAAVVCDERNRAELEAAGPACPVLLVPDESLFAAGAEHGAPPHADLRPDEPCLITFTSGTAGEAKAVVHGQRYLAGQALQAGTWLGAGAADLVWCTAASGWSKSARNVFIAPWIRGAAALLHDERFDPHQRLALLEEERVNVLCMAPTEFRVVAKRAEPRPIASLRGLVAAGEALNPEILRAFHAATGLWIRDGYGQTETGQTTGQPPGAPPKPGSMGLALEGIRLLVDDGELCLDPLSDPTFFLGYLGEGVVRGEDGTWRVDDRRAAGEWRTGDRVTRDDDGYLFFEGRADDVIISAGYRIGPFEVESALVSHPAVAEAAAVAAPDEERGAVVRAIVVLREGHAPSEELAVELQDHVKGQTAPYKYPRIVEFADELPKTASGKVRRSTLRETPAPASGTRRAADTTELRDDAGRLLATYIQGHRGGRPLADLLEAAPGVSDAEVAALAMTRFRGWEVGPARPLGEALVAAGATPTRAVTIMTRELGTPAPRPDVPQGITIERLDRPADDLIDAIVAAFPPGHPDHRPEGRERELADLSALLSGAVVGPVLGCSRLALDAAGAVVGAAIVCDHGGMAPPLGGPWLAELFRDPQRSPGGTGAALLCASLEEARAEGLPQMGLAVTLGNPARSVYERLGFLAVADVLNVVVPA